MFLKADPKPESENAISSEFLERERRGRISCEDLCSIFLRGTGLFWSPYFKIWRSEIQFNPAQPIGTDAYDSRCFVRCKPYVVLLFFWNEFKNRCCKVLRWSEILFQHNTAHKHKNKDLTALYSACHLCRHNIYIQSTHTHTHTHTSIYNCWLKNISLFFCHFRKKIHFFTSVLCS